MIKYAKYLAVLPLFALSLAASADFTEEDVRNSFYPYENWTPEFPGYTPGMVIDQSNVEQFKDILDPALYDHIIKGQTALQTKVTESLELHPGYIRATMEAVKNPPSLSADGLVDNFVAGRAFPCRTGCQ